MCISGSSNWAGIWQLVLEDVCVVPRQACVDGPGREEVTGGRDSISGHGTMRGSVSQF